jgi:anaerobic magnesium-protoporphyrin IX monomethyl ester cyclase
MQPPRVRVSLVNVLVHEATNLVPPLGVLQLAAILRAHGFEVQVLDEDPLLVDVVGAVARFEPALVGLSFYTPAFGRAKQLAHALRAACPQAVICAGGIHATALPEATGLALGLDFCGIGEGDQTLLEVCERVRDGLGLGDVPGLWVREGETGRFTSPRPLIEDLDALPYPARDAVDFRRYLAPPGVFRGRPMRNSTTLLTVRGCPFPCTYCGSHIMSGRRVRFRSVDAVVGEVEGMVRDLGVRGLFVLDESFTIRRERAAEIAAQLKRLGLVWGIQTRVDLLDEDLLRHFAACGCAEVNFGVESGSDRILDLLRKGTTVEQAVRAFSWCRRAGLRTTANFMMGHPLETRADLEATYRLARRLAATNTFFHRTIPYPGTDLHREALDGGWLTADAAWGESWMHRSGAASTMRTQVPHEELTAKRSAFQNRFFLRNYLQPRSLRWVGYYLLQAALHPGAFARALRSMVRDRRLDRFLEVFAADLNRLSRAGESAGRGAPAIPLRATLPPP